MNPAPPVIRIRFAMSSGAVRRLSVAPRSGLDGSAEKFRVSDSKIFPSIVPVCAAHLLDSAALAYERVRGKSRRVRESRTRTRAPPRCIRIGEPSPRAVFQEENSANSQRRMGTTPSCCARKPTERHRTIFLRRCDDFRIRNSDDAPLTENSFFVLHWNPTETGRAFCALGHVPAPPRQRTILSMSTPPYIMRVKMRMWPTFAHPFLLSPSLSPTSR